MNAGALQVAKKAATPAWIAYVGPQSCGAKTASAGKTYTGIGL
jgi:hypothetical protein